MTPTPSAFIYKIFSLLRQLLQRTFKNTMCGLGGGGGVQGGDYKSVV